MKIKNRLFILAVIINFIGCGSNTSTTFQENQENEQNKTQNQEINQTNPTTDNQNNSDLNQSDQINNNLDDKVENENQEDQLKLLNLLKISELKIDNTEIIIQNGNFREINISSMNKLTFRIDEINLSTSTLTKPIIIRIDEINELNDTKFILSFENIIYANNNLSLENLKQLNMFVKNGNQNLSSNIGISDTERNNIISYDGIILSLDVYKAIELIANKLGNDISATDFFKNGNKFNATVGFAGFKNINNCIDVSEIFYKGFSNDFLSDIKNKVEQNNTTGFFGLINLI